MENSSEGIVCIVCERPSGAFFAKRNGYSLYTCPTCGLLFVHPVPAESSAVYSEDYFSGATSGYGYVNYDNDKRAMKSAFLKYLSLIESNYGTKGRILDIGAANGFFVARANENGWKAEGIEISDFAASEARKRGLSVKTGVLMHDTYSPNTFDVVTMWDVFEHVTDPIGTLATICAILRPQGLVALNTPDAGSVWARLFGRYWHLIVPPEHLFLFNQKNITDALRKANFEVLLITRVGKKFTLGYILKALFQRIPVFRKIPFSGSGMFWNKILVPIHLRDNMFVIARKKDVA